jgi:ubiquinone/menaquinone biosynthesis C-methylase UbiE
MSHRVCPFWVGYLLRNPLRRLLHDPRQILAPFVRPGMTVLDIGCAMGFFTLPLAEMAGPQGRVIAVDVQERMLAALRKRAARAGLLGRIDSRLAPADTLGLEDLAGQVDFALAFAVVHEVPDAAGLFRELAGLLHVGGLCLLAEPKGHVGSAAFECTLAAAKEAGFAVREGPRIIRCHSAVLVK